MLSWVTLKMSGMFFWDTLYKPTLWKLYSGIWCPRINTETEPITDFSWKHRPTLTDLEKCHTVITLHSSPFTITGRHTWNSLPLKAWDASLTPTQFPVLMKSALFYTAYETLAQCIHDNSGVRTAVLTQIYLLTYCQWVSSQLNVQLNNRPF